MFTTVLWFGVLGVAATAMLGVTLFTFLMPEKGPPSFVRRLGRWMPEAWRRLQARRRMHLRVEQLDARIDTRTEDGEAIEVTVAVHYYVPVPYPVLPASAYEVFDELEHMRQKITACLTDVVETHVSKTKRSDLLEAKGDLDLAERVKSDLAQVMEGFGCEILEVFVRGVRVRDTSGPSANERAAVDRWEGEGGGS